MGIIIISNVGLIEMAINWYQLANVFVQILIQMCKNIKVINPYKGFFLKRFEKKFQNHEKLLRCTT
jgi:hypothetical protein